MNTDIKRHSEMNLLNLYENTKLFSENLAIVMGSESKGLRKLVKDTCDITARINIKNSVESLNVSAALAISLYEMNRS